MKNVLIATLSMLMGIMMGYLIEDDNHKRERSKHETDVNSYADEVNNQRTLLVNTEFNLEQCKANYNKSVDIINDLTAIVNMQLDLFYDLPLDDIDTVRKARPKPPYLKTVTTDQPQVLEGLQ